MNYNVELSTEELYSLNEALANLTKFMVADYNGMNPGQLHMEPMTDPLFVAVCKIRLKLAKTENPDSRITLADFLNYGNFGRSS